MTTTNTTIALSPAKLDKQRAAFEAAMATDLRTEQGEFAMARSYSEGNPYTFLATKWAWKAWQAALIAQARAAQPTVEAVADEEWEDCHHCCSTGVQDGEECRHCHGRGVNRIEFDEEAVQIPAAPEVDARLVLLLAAASGYEARHEYGRITPDQWGDILRVCEGKLSSAAQQQQAGAAAPSLVRECKYPHETDKCLGCGWRAATSQDQGASPAQASAAQSDAEQARAAVPTTGKRHELKTDPAVFAAVLAGAKTHEIRKNDRGFAVGDELLLRETTHTGAEIAAGAPLEYTGRTITRTVSHVLTGYGLQEGWCILSLAASPTVPAQPVAAAADAGGLIEVGELIEIPDGLGERPNTIMANWNEARWGLPAGTRLFAGTATSAAAQPVAKVGESADVGVLDDLLTYPSPHGTLVGLADAKCRLAALERNLAGALRALDWLEARCFDVLYPGSPYATWQARGGRMSEKGSDGHLSFRAAIDAAMQSTTTGATDGAVGGAA